MKVKYVKLTNFQSHSKRVVKFGPNITTIIGDTDRGKSSIIRALGWALQNNIAGDDFIKEGEKMVEVKVKVLDEEMNPTVILRSRTAAGGNTYSMDDDEYKAFGRKVPEDIAAKLSINQINFQGQHDPSFWFSETAGEVSRRLNAVIDLAVIDSAMKYVNDEVRRIDWTKTLAVRKLKEVEDELEDRKPQRLRIASFLKLEKLANEKIEREDNRDRLGALIDDVRSNNPSRHEQRAEEAQGALDLGDEFCKAEQKAYDLCQQVTQFKRHQSNATPPPSFVTVEKTYHSQGVLFQRRNHLAEVLGRLQTAIDRYDKTEKEAGEKQSFFHDKIKGTICPLCENLAR